MLCGLKGFRLLPESSLHVYSSVTNLVQVSAPKLHYTSRRCDFNDACTLLAGKGHCAIVQPHGRFGPALKAGHSQDHQ